MDAFIQFLFKYRPIVFEKGHLAFGTSWPIRLAVLAVGLVVLAAVTTYTRVRIRGTRSDRYVLGGIRVLALLLLVFALLRPMLLTSAAVSQRNVVGVLIDDSRSMQLKDMQGRARADVVRSLLGSPDSALYKALAKRFAVRVFRVGNGGSPVPAVANLQFNGERTRFAPALEGVRQELIGYPFAGVVLVSDGADNGVDSLNETLATMNARHIPVFTVGVGQERFAKDIEVSRVEAPRTVLRGTATVMNVSLTHRGFGGSTVQLVVEDNSHVVTTQSVTFPKDREDMVVRVHVPARVAGPRLFTVRIAPQPGEVVTENNAQTVLMVVQDQREKILYVEGEPRFEFTFLRRAVDNDPNLQLASMLRAGKSKFLRFGLDNSTELASGFPTSREELFQYRGIVLGSIEASFFSFDQLQMLSDFVSQRGGGLLMLGGRQSFSEGGYFGTPVADALPVELPLGAKADGALHDVKVNVTPIGSISAQTQIANTEDASIKEWKTMPVLTSVNHITRAKPGATTLLDGEAPHGGDRSVILAAQRYGRGKAIAFPVQDSWLWQMRFDTPTEDETYKTFWRQTLRWLVSDVPDRVMVSTASDRAWANEPLQVDAHVADQAYHPVDNADVMATIYTPSGTTVQQRLWPSPAQGSAAYHAAYTPTERGMYRIMVTAKSPSDTMVVSKPAYVEVGTPTNEFVGAELHTSLLQRIADKTGGRYYTPATATRLAEDLVYVGGGDALMERLDLWDMPIMLLLLLGLLAGEWGYRRARGLI